MLMEYSFICLSQQVSASSVLSMCTLCSSERQTGPLPSWSSQSNTEEASASQLGHCSPYMGDILEMFKVFLVVNMNGGIPLAFRVGAGCYLTCVHDY